MGLVPFRALLAGSGYGQVPGRLLELQRSRRCRRSRWSLGLCLGGGVSIGGDVRRGLTLGATGADGLGLNRLPPLGYTCRWGGRCLGRNGGSGSRSWCGGSVPPRRGRSGRTGPGLHLPGVLLCNLESLLPGHLRADPSFPLLRGEACPTATEGPVISYGDGTLGPLPGAGNGQHVEAATPIGLHLGDDEGLVPVKDDSSVAGAAPTVGNLGSLGDGDSKGD